MFRSMRMILAALPLLMLLSACGRSDVYRDATGSARESNSGQLARLRDAGAPAEMPEITVYKSPTCGCCSEWVKHLESNGFTVRANDMPDVSQMRTRLGVPQDLGSCHTAVVGGYVVEGHVPANIIKRMVEERPDITGIAVPGMPIGSPGMEVPGRTAQSYEVIAFDRRGARIVFETV